MPAILVAIFKNRENMVMGQGSHDFGFTSEASKMIQTTGVNHFVMNDNINSRYRQLEMPMRKEDPVTAQHKKLERLIRLTRHANDCSSFEKQELSMRVCGEDQRDGEV